MASFQVFKKSTYRDTGTLKYRCASENVFPPFDKIIWRSHFYGKEFIVVIAI